MQILTINCGTRSLRFDVLESDHGYGEPIKLLEGVIQGIGSNAKLTLEKGLETTEEAVVAADHRQALDAAVTLLQGRNRYTSIEAICHRVLHGGLELQRATLLDDHVLRKIEQAQEFAPRDNAAALAAIEASQAQFSGLPMVAVFDTAFFAALPESAARYAIPRAISDELGLRKFGGQGFAHRYMDERFRARRPDDHECRVITLQLGSDCSVTTVRNGQPLNTSMGFSLAQGLVFGRRSGDLDPNIPLLLMNRGGLSSEQAWRMLNTESGLLAACPLRDSEFPRAGAEGEEWR